jgi:hypothetical protein
MFSEALNPELQEKLASLGRRNGKYLDDAGAVDRGVRYLKRSILGICPKPWGKTMSKENTVNRLKRVGVEEYVGDVSEFVDELIQQQSLSYGVCSYLSVWENKNISGDKVYNFRVWAE